MLKQKTAFIPEAGRADLMVRCDKDSEVTYYNDISDKHETLATIKVKSSPKRFLQTAKSGELLPWTPEFPHYIRDLRNQTLHPVGDGCNCSTSIRFLQGHLFVDNSTLEEQAKSKWDNTPMFPFDVTNKTAG